VPAAEPGAGPISGSEGAESGGGNA